MRSDCHVLAPVVPTLDSAVHWINYSPTNKYYGNRLRYSMDTEIYQVDSVIHLLGNWREGVGVQPPPPSPQKVRYNAHYSS